MKFIIAPYRISDSEWEMVYEDALQILNQCNLVDNEDLRQDRQSPKITECELKNGQLGIFICWTVGNKTKNFILYRALKQYRDQVKDSDNGTDILLGGLYPKGNEIPEVTGIIHVWTGKAEELSKQLPIIAIMLLFADRFPKAVKVAGNIPTDQYYAAMQLANQYLPPAWPMLEPLVCRPGNLIGRLRAAGLSEEKRLKLFFKLYSGHLTPRVGKLLQLSLSHSSLYRYYKEKLLGKEMNCVHTCQIIHEYFQLGFSFDDLISIMVTDPEGNRLPLKNFLEGIISHGLCFFPLDEVRVSCQKIISSNEFDEIIDNIPK